MKLTELHILNYKNIAEADIAFADKINCFIGKNGMGKTNVLDAIYYLSFCKSHTNYIDSQNIKHGEDFSMIKGEYELPSQTMTLSCGMKRGRKKQFKRDQKEYQRLSDHIGVVPLVLVSPQDNELVGEGSDERRKFIDGVISQYNRVYLQHLLAYNQTLQQRNALLKRDEWQEDVAEVLEAQLAHYAAYIFEQRQLFVEQFVPIFEQYYELISGGSDRVSLAYRSQLQERDLIIALAATRERDRILGFTTQGIHKDDLQMLLGDYPLKRVGSQGQQKSYLLALKLAEYEFLRQAHGVKPLLLLDDLFDRLDAERVRNTIELVNSDRFGQIFITDTNLAHLDDIVRPISQAGRIFHVADGVVTAE